VVRGEDGTWMQEEVVVTHAATTLKHTLLTDEWIRLCLECALHCKPPKYSRWQDFYDVVTGQFTLRFLGTWNQAKVNNFG
jgi:hypothetical protein